MIDTRLEILREEAKFCAASSRILRKYEKQCKAQAIYERAARSNLDSQWNKRRESTHKQRKQLGVRSRYLGLARGFTRGKSYYSMEQSTHLNNRVNITALLLTLASRGFKFQPSVVENWLNDE